jgi:hypothetical protein
MEIAAILARLEAALKAAPEYIQTASEVVQWLESHVGSTNTTPPTS